MVKVERGEVDWVKVEFAERWWSRNGTGIPRGMEIWEGEKAG